MKILIGYDGSACAEAALDDLRTAGLPEENVEAVVISVAEVWLPPPPKNEPLGEYAVELQTHPQPFKAYQTSAKAVTESETFAKHGRNRLRQMFPSWRVEAQADYGSPAWEIITKANEIKADLIVVGSHGRTAIGNLFLGSVSNKVLTEARCSVRVARGKIEVDPAPSLIIIGFDGSAGALGAVEAVASRKWREQSEVTLLAVSDPVMPSAIGRFVPPIASWVEETNAGECQWLQARAEHSRKKLEAAGLKTNFIIIPGNPKHILVEEARQLHADSIFVGATAEGYRLEMFLLGSVAAAIAARAACSVEVVRQ